MPETKPKTKRGTARGPRRPGQTTDGWQLARLRQELTATKEFLQSIIAEREAANAELQTANEEILSSNEELQSTNEELETAQEELQSVNEELTTVNEELQHRNGELALANNDLRNLFGSVNIAIVMLDRDGRIRRFTAKAAEVLKLVPADVGLPIGDTRPSIDLVDLEGVCSRVIETGTVSECEVRTRDGRWYSLRVGPYKTSDDRIEGAVLTLVDVTTLKTSVEEVTAARDYAEAIVDTVRVPLVVLDGELRVRSASRSFYETFRVSPEQTTNHLIYELGNGQWNIPALRDVLSQVLERDARFEDLEVTHDFPYLGPRTMLLCARHVRRGGKDARLVLLAIEDITTHAERAPAASKVH
jgi:two-component system CheB/CheR fusion protein